MVLGMGIPEECMLAGAVCQYHQRAGCMQDWGHSDAPGIVSVEMHCAASALAGRG